MAEPGTTASVCAGAAIALPCSLLGASTDAVIVGMVAAVGMSLWLQSIDDKPKAFVAVLMSSLVAAYASTWVAKLLVAVYPAFGGDLEGLRQACSFVLGGLGPTVIPRLVGRAEKKAEGI